jgi:archaellum biogenesis protein FlaJ (TadC family)
LKTREAYKVIVKRIEANIIAVKRSYVSLYCFLVFGLIFVLLGAVDLGVDRDNFLISPFLPLFLFGILLFFYALILFPVRSAKMKKDKEVKEVAILRRDAAGPSSALQLPDWLQERQNKRSGGTTFNDSPKYYVRAAACGAVSNTG